MELLFRWLEVVPLFKGARLPDVFAGAAADRSILRAFLLYFLLRILRTLLHAGLSWQGGLALSALLHTILTIFSQDAFFVLHLVQPFF